MLLNILSNALVLAFEMALVALAAYAAWTEPLLFSLATALIATGLGLSLEYRRLENEFAFYFGRALGSRSMLAVAYASGEALIKGLLAGLATVLTFAGTDAERLWYVALVFAATVFAGTSLLRWLTLSLGANPARWGYFRLAAALGLVFSASVTGLAYAGLIENPTLTDIVKTAVWETASRPPIEEASELLFKLKQYLDGAIAGFLSIWVGEEGARFLSVVLSVNMLTGFVAAIYALMISTAVQRLDRALP